jgi:UDP-galactopyranose mutase
MNLKKYKLVVVGAGLFGSVIAEQASRNGIKVAVIESRNHIGGNCYTETDPVTGINVHVYGAHIFHTNNRDIWDYINQFTEFNGYRHTVKSKSNGKTYSMPINLDTINSFYNCNYTPMQAKAWLDDMRSRYANPDPENFEEQAMALIGPELYQAFIKGYTLKQWETDPKELPASIIRRLPVRTNYNDSYFFDQWQGIPVNGYTPIFERMLTHENIDLYLNTQWEDIKPLITDQLVIYTGAIDRYFDYCYGDLNWRTLDFKLRTEPVEDYQGCVALNYADLDVPYTREIEHKHFHPEKKTAGNATIVSQEYSRTALRQDTPYYPVNTPADKELFSKYQLLSESETNVIFGGRLGEYMYYDMHQVIGSALACYRNKVSQRIQPD